MVRLWTMTTLLIGAAVGAAEPWLDDPANSKWIVFDGSATEENGVSVVPGGKEGKPTPATLAGEACCTSVREDGENGFFYLAAEPWDALSQWVGEDNELLLTIRFYDGGAGRLTVSYDSSDPTVKHASGAYPPGTWKHPPDSPDGIELTGSETFRTTSVRLPLAWFQKRLHGGDIRIQANAPFALRGVALTRVPKGSDPDLLVKQELRIARATGLVPCGKGARFAGSFVQKGDAPIVMEAEHATELSLQSPHTPRLAPDASGGAYVHYVESGLWRFTVVSPGTYTMWQRAFFPWKGYWNHDEEMDGRQGGNNADGVRVPEEGWQWIKSLAYDLTPGDHEFKLSYHGGARLDVLVLSQADSPPELSSLVSSYDGPRSGELWTVPVQPFDVGQWRGASLQFPAKGIDAVCEFSTDGGQTWQLTSQEAGLADVPVRGGGQDSMQLHVALGARDDASPPLFEGGSVIYHAGPNNVKTIENSALRLDMDPYGVRALFDKRRGKAVCQASRMHGPLLSILVKKPGPAMAVSQDLYNATLEKIDIAGSPNKPTLSLTHLLACGVRTTSSVTLSPDGQIEWKLDIENPTGLEVAEIRYPVLTGCTLGDAATDDSMFVPKCWGQVWQNPGTRRLTTYWGPAMRWMALWDADQGLYFGLEDARLDDYGFVFGGDSSGGTTIGACQRILVESRSRWTSATYRMATIDGDWHEAADIYRATVQPALKPCDVPEHVKWLLDAWGHQQSNDMPTRGWAAIQDSYDAMQRSGVYLMAANRQMLDGADSGYCGLYPYPCLAWGSMDEFQQQLQALRDRGGAYVPYHNFHLWAPGYGPTRRIGSFPKTRLPADIPQPGGNWYRDAVTYNYNGSYPHVEADPFAQVGMAMAAPEWQDWLIYWTDQYLDYGADGMYYDQLNMIYPNGRLYPDYRTYGCWTTATLDTVANIKGAARAKNPFYVASGEVCNDLYGQFVDLHMTSGVFNRLDIYQYCNPSQLLIDGGWNNGLAVAFGGWERERFVWQMGARFEGLQGPQGEWDEWSRQVLALRRRVKSLLYQATFRDTVGLRIHDAAGNPIEPELLSGSHQSAPCRGVIGRWFLLDKGEANGAVINLINAVTQGDRHTPRGDAFATLKCDDIGTVRYAMAWTLDGRSMPIAGEQKGNAYTFRIPSSELATVVLSAGVPPVVEWELDDIAAPGTRRLLRLTITNVNPDPTGGHAQLDPPPGWPRLDPIKFGPVLPGSRLSFSVPVNVPQSAEKGRYEVRCRVETAHGVFTTYSLLPVADPILAEFRGDPGAYHLWFRNLTDRPQSATIAGAVPAPLAITAFGEVDIPSYGEVVLPIGVDGRDKLTEIAELGAKVTFIGAKMTRVGDNTVLEDVEKPLVRGVMPVMPNGDFERDSAQDGKPDWWMCRNAAHTWRYGHLSMDSSARSGQFCARLDPPGPGDECVFAYPVNGVLTPNTRYRVSVWIRSAAGAGVSCRVYNTVLGEGKTDNQWREFTAEFATPDRLVGYHVAQVLRNASDKPAYFDGLDIRELGPER